MRSVIDRRTQVHGLTLALHWYLHQAVLLHAFTTDVRPKVHARAIVGDARVVEHGGRATACRAVDV